MQSGRLDVTSKSKIVSWPTRSRESMGMPTAVSRAPTSAGSSPGSTYSFSQSRLNFISPSQRELFQEPEIVLEEQPDVVDAIFQHGDPIHPEPEDEAGEGLGVVADGAQHIGVNHTGAAHFQPSGLLAGPATSARAEDTADVELRSGLDEREVARAEPDLEVRAEDPPG